FPEGDEGALLPVYSDKAGVVRINRAGTRVLMSDSRTGRVIEVDLATGEPLWVYEKISTIAPFLKARHLKADADHVRFSTQGAEYVEDMTPFR
ncbi:MAG: hypothetical protein H6923_06555, partial [Alphaproteobacteria bacterium]|nr:hypothetical protein [Alphaproteobacteria bacterium]